MSEPATQTSACCASDDRRVSFQALFESIPENIVVVRADDPSFTIVAASDAHLRLFNALREQILGRSFFEVYPEGPYPTHAATMSQLRVSFRRVIETGQPHSMPVQRYDLPSDGANGGSLEERYWSPVNSPVAGPDDVVHFVIHRAEDVTALIQLKRREEERGRIAETERVRADQMQAELLLSTRLLADSQRLVEERTQLIKELRESETRFRSAVGAVDSLLWTNNARGAWQTRDWQRR